MKQLLLALRELKQVMVQVAFSEAIFETAIVMLITMIVCVLVNLPIVWGLVPVALFFIHSTRSKFKDIHLKQVEEKYPELDEQLRAAADNLYRKNDLVEALQQDVLGLMRKIKTSSFIQFKKMWRQLVIIAALSFAVILLTSLNMQFLDYRIIVDEIKDLGKHELPNIFEAEFAAGFGDESDIFGNESLAELGLEQLDIQISPIFSEINLQDIREARETTFEEGVFPSDIEARITSQEGGENIPKEHKEIVKNYFSGLAREG